jgi:hypothetical protein
MHWKKYQKNDKWKNRFSYPDKRKRVYKFATGDKPFFPYMTKITTLFLVYQVFQKWKMGLCPVAN